MSPSQREIERWIGAVLVPEVRVAGTIASASEIVPSRDYLERFPPAGVVAFGRTPRGAVSPTELIARVRATCRELGNPEPFAACDLEQGAGLHFAEGTRLPPALAIASAALCETEPGEWPAQFPSWLFDVAGIITGHEARSFGVDLVLAPVCDVNTRGNNPIIGVRSFGDDPKAVAERAWAFHTGLHMGGVAGCAKHFPGHGDTTQDSHIELARVDWSESEMLARALPPFRELSCADACMVGHLDVPSLTGASGLPCTLSPRAIQEYLRIECAFVGAVLSDAMNMGALAREPERYSRALAAGCDGLLCPHDNLAAAEELLDAVERGAVDLDRLEDAARRVQELRRPVDLTPFDPAPESWAEFIESHARLLGDRALRCSRDEWPWPRDGRCTVLAPLSATESPEVLAGLADLRSALTPAADRAVLPVVCELRAFTGRYGLTGEEHAELDRRISSATPERPLALLWFGSPQALPARLWRDPRAAILLAFAPTPPMFAAAARALCGGAIARGSLPCALG